MKNKVLLWLSGLAAAVLVGFFIFSANKKEVVVAEATPKEKSIIVLPFKNLSSDKENQYLADGMVDAISRHLSSIESLDVINSSASGPLTSISEIGEKLNVSNVLQGSLQKHDSTLRIEIKLVDTENGKQLWAESFDRKVSDVLHIQNEIAIAVANLLGADLNETGRGLIDRRSSYNPKAYDFYLKGLYYGYNYTAEAQELAFENLNAAIAIDSSIAPAYLGLATYYNSKATVLFAELSPKEAFQKSKVYIDKAIELAPDMKEVRGWEGYRQLYYNWNFEKAEKGIKYAVDRNVVLAHNVYIELLNYEHRHEEALKVCKQLDDQYPFSPDYMFINTYYYLNQWSKAAEQVESQLKLHPNDYLVLDSSSFFMLNTGNYDEAINLCQKAIKNTGLRYPRMLGWMGAAYANENEPQKARELLRELKRLKKKTDAGSPAWFVAVIHSALGEKQEALKWIATAIDDREMEVPWLVSEPQFYPLHGMPEFDALVKRVGFREHAYPVELPET